MKIISLGLMIAGAFTITHYFNVSEFKDFAVIMAAGVLFSLGGALRGE